MIEVTDRDGPIGDGLQVAASLLALPQVAMVALALQRLADGGGLAAMAAPAAGFIGFAVLRALAEAAGARRCFRAARRSLTASRRAAIAAVAGRHPFDRAAPAAGAVASVIAEQSDALLAGATRYAPARARVRLVPVVCALAVLPLSWLAALVLLCAAPLIPLFMAVIGWRAKAASEAHLADLGRLQGFLLDRLRGLATIRALGAVPATAARLAAVSADLRDRIMAVLRIAFLSSAVLELFAALGVALVAVYIGFHLLGEIGIGTWGRRLALGEAAFILMVAPVFFEPLRELAAAWHDRAAAQAAGEAIARLSAAPAPSTVSAQPAAAAAAAAAAHAVPAAGAATGAVDPPAPAPGPPAIAIRGLRHRYPGDPAPVFEGFSLAVAAGERVALVGPSGRGKSTLLALLAGLMPVDAGEIRIDGVLLDDATRDALQARIGWMTARPWLRASTLRDNVSLGRPLPAAGIDAVLHGVGLDPDRPGLAGAGAHGRLSESGDGLSGGEWARIALARATVDPARDLLLVDEPTAHLDSRTATAVTDALLQAARGRTLIVATHDPVLAGRLDRIIRLDALPVPACPHEGQRRAA